MNMVLTYKDIERIAAAVSQDFADTVQGAGEAPCVPIERLAAKYLGLSVSYARLSGDGSVLGVTAYGDTEYDTGSRVIQMKRNQVLMDLSLAVLSGNTDAMRRRRFTLAHECAHQILFQLGVQEDATASYALCRAPGCAHRDWGEWQANALGAALLMPADGLDRAIRELCGGRPLSGCGTSRTWLIIEHLCSRFRVSRSAMRIRLRRLGYGCYGVMEVCA